jgi:exodeoxyribonuclease VII small subunit
MATKQPTFDDGLNKLEAMVQKLESGSLGLEDALQCFEDGINLSSALQKQLAGAQRKIEVLRQGLAGEYVAGPLDGAD